MTERKKRILWTLAVIIAFIIGFLLGRRYCERHTNGGAGGGVVLGGGGGAAGGGGGRFAPGKGGGTSKSNGGYLKTPVDTDSSGGGNVAPGGGGTSVVGGGNGGGNSNTPYDSGEQKKLPKPVDTLSTGFVAQMSKDMLTGRGPKDPSPPEVNINTKTADDFSLDQTALPRFPMDVTTAFSSVSTRTDKPADTGTATAFATSDSFDSVTSWYSHHMPAGAQGLSVDANKLKAMAKQLSPQNIMKMFTGSADSAKPIDTAAVDSTGPGSKMSAWKLPDDGVHGERQVTVLYQPGKPTTILMSRSRRP
jgi:hypothetical protein